MAVPPVKRKTFSNFSNKIPLSIDQMYKQLISLTDGFPIVVSGVLHYLDDDNKLQPLASVPALFAWIDSSAAVFWKRGAITKDEFLEGLRQRASKYDWATDYPHFPQIEGVYYTRKRLRARNTGALDALVDRFAPATEVDRQLIKALVLTLFWGGPPGKRPSFVITSQEGRDRQQGRGRGKTTMAELFARLVGGNISVRTHANPERVQTSLLSPSALPLRVALLDNVKTYRLSSEFIEALITCESIDGHRLYVGHAVRPNFLLWLITVNGANFSKDMAQRSIVIKLRRFTATPSWYSETVAYIDAHRSTIIADVRWHLEQEAVEMTETDRWQVWVDGVLSRFENANELLVEIKRRRGKIDEDDEDAADTIAHFRAWLKTTLAPCNPATAHVRIPSPLAVKVLRLLKTGMTDRQAALYLKQLNHARLSYYHAGKERGYLWVGEDADKALPPTVLLYEVRLPS
jgi:hypothetical protein